MQATSQDVMQCFQDLGSTAALPAKQQRAGGAAERACLNSTLLFMNSM